jgi:hypothetical protein
VRNCLTVDRARIERWLNAAAQKLVVQERKNESVTQILEFRFGGSRIAGGDGAGTDYRRDC